MTLKNSFYLFLILLVMVLLKFYTPVVFKVFNPNSHYFECDDIASISISDNTNSTLLSFADNKWKVNHFPVSDLSLSLLKESIYDINQADLITTVDTKHSIFKLATPSHRVDILFKDNDSLSFHIGKQGPYTGSNYLKFLDSPAIYLSDNYLSYIFSSDPTYWTDLVLIDLAKVNINRIEFIFSSFVQTYLFKKNTWYLQGKNKDGLINASYITTFLNSFFPLKADRIYLKPTLPTLDESKLKFRFKLYSVNKQVQEFAFYHDKNNSFYIVNLAKPSYIYWIEQVLFSNFSS